MNISLALLTAHFIGDALLQNNWMALGKSKRFLPLTVHAAVYATCFLPWGAKFVLVTFITHWLTDFCTSRVSSKLWFLPMQPIPVKDPQEGIRIWTHYCYIDDSKRHWFFVWLLLDQLIHFFTLAFTAYYLL